MSRANKSSGLTSVIKTVFSSLLLVSIGACSSSNDEPDAPEITAPSISDGYYLSAENITFTSSFPSRRLIYDLDNNQKTLSRYTESSTGNIRYDVVYDYNDIGLITSNRNVDAAGVAIQTFNNVYDDQNRLSSGTSFNGVDSFLTTVYEFNAAGTVSRKIVTTTANGSAFSDTVYQYDNDGQLQSSSLTSPLLTTPIVRTYAFTSVGNLLESVTDNDGANRQLQYDANGNVSVEESYAGDGRLLRTTTFEYTETDLVVPNLTRFRLVYEFDQY